MQNNIQLALSVDKGAPRHLGCRLDGGVVLSAQAFRLSYESACRIADERDLQGHGMKADADHHEPCGGGKLDIRSNDGVAE